MSERRVFRCRDVSEAWEIDAERAELGSGPYETLVSIVDVRVANGRVVRLGVPDWFVEMGAAESPEFVYLVQRGSKGPLKIGYSADPRKRVQALQTASAERLDLLFVIPADNARQLEEALHRKFEHFRMEGEWFRCESEILTSFELIQKETHP